MVTPVTMYMDTRSDAGTCSDPQRDLKPGPGGLFVGEEALKVPT